MAAGSMFASVRTDTLKLMNLLTMTEAAERLRKTPRWLTSWLRGNPQDANGIPYCRQAGRTRLFTETDVARIVEALLPCRSSSSRPAKARRRTGRSAGHTSVSTWTEAEELTGVTLQPSSSETFKSASNVATFPTSRLRRERQPS
jgi:hypothetical protein